MMLQVYFTILLAWMALGERPRRMQAIGAAIAFAGIAVIGSDRIGGAGLGPFLLVVLAALLGGGQRGRQDRRKNRRARLTVWSSLAAPLPLLALSLVFDGTWPLVGLAHPTWRLILSVLVIAYAGTLFGFGLWARLLAHYSAATVAPFALLVRRSAWRRPWSSSGSRCGRSRFSARFW